MVKQFLNVKMISFEIFKQEKCQPPLLRRPAPAPYSHPLFEFFRTTPHPPPPPCPFERGNQNLLSPFKNGGGGGVVNCKMYKKKGHQLPVDKTSIFSSPKSFFRQSLDAPLRNLERCNLFRSLG